MTTIDTLPDTLCDATDAARSALANYWTSPFTSMTTAVRCECFRSGRRYVAQMTRDGWTVGSGKILSAAECGEYRTLLMRGPSGAVIVAGSHGPCWISDGRAMQCC